LLFRGCQDRLKGQVDCQPITIGRLIFLISIKKVSSSPNNTMDEMNNDQVMGEEQAPADMPAEETTEADAAPEVTEETGEEAA
jgi:hypothetical protein